MTISFINGKGGVGKSTCTVLIAHALAESGQKVGIVDRDPQQTSTKWLNELEDPPVELADRNTAYAAVCIDTPPRIDSRDFREPVATSDRIIVVTTESPHDLWTSQETVIQAKKHKKRNAKIRLLFNAVSPYTILGKGIDELVSRIGAPRLQTIITRKQCYKHSALLGWQALNSEAKEELYKVALEIIGS